MQAMEFLDKMTQISLDALWKIQVQECVDTSKLSKTLIYPEKEPVYISLLYHMEEGTLPPTPQELPMPPPAWLV